MHVEENSMLHNTPGTIILLNGTASAGKTSMARAIQQVFDTPYLHVGIDLFWEAIFPHGWAGAERAGWEHVPIAGSSPPKIALAMQPFGQLLMSGLHHTVAALAAVGH